MRRTAFIFLASLVLTACGALGAQGEGKTNPVTAVFKDPLTSAQLKKALLTTKDLPPGYEANSDVDDGEDSEESTEKVTEGGPACARLWKELDLDSKKRRVGDAAIAFGHDDYGILAESISSYRGSKAKTDLAVIEAALKQCRTFKTGNDDLPYKVKPIPFPKLGDQTVAMSVTTSEPTLGLTFTFQWILVRVDQSKIGLLTLAFGEGGLDSAKFEKVARTAVQRVQAVS